MAQLNPVVALGALLPVIGAVIADALMSTVGIAAVLGASNQVAWGISLVFGLLTTGFVVATKFVITRRAPLIFVGPWFVFVLIDFYTTIACTDHFVIRKKGLDDIAELTFQTDSIQAFAVLAASAAITVTAISAPWVAESLPDESVDHPT